MVRRVRDVRIDEFTVCVGSIRALRRGDWIHIECASDRSRELVVFGKSRTVQVREIHVLSHAEALTAVLTGIDSEGVALEAPLLTADDAVLREIASAYSG